ncbi:MAG: MetQ/NlpA family ABC transporter substrate-binding protein [Acetobacteraceae bacterium]
MTDTIQFAAELARKHGLDVKVVEFSDWVMPNQAVADGDADANFFEHTPFLNDANKARGYGLIPVAPAVVMPMALFSHKVTSLDQLKDGARAAIANDPVNGGRGLLLFQKAGLIKLRPDVGDTATPADIIDNPKHLRFIALEAPQLARALDDVDVAQVSITYLVASGGDPHQALITDGAGDLHYAIQFVARPDHRDDPRLVKFISIFRSPEERAFITSHFAGAISPAW